MLDLTIENALEVINNLCGANNPVKKNSPIIIYNSENDWLAFFFSPGPVSYVINQTVYSKDSDDIIYSRPVVHMLNEDDDWFFVHEGRFSMAVEDTFENIDILNRINKWSSHFLNHDNCGYISTTALKNINLIGIRWHDICKSYEQYKSYRDMIYFHIDQMQSAMTHKKMFDLTGKTINGIDIDEQIELYNTHNDAYLALVDKNKCIINDMLKKYKGKLYY